MKYGNPEGMGDDQNVDAPNCAEKWKARSDRAVVIIEPSTARNLRGASTVSSAWRGLMLEAADELESAEREARFLQGQIGLLKQTHAGLKNSEMPGGEMWRLYDRAFKSITEQGNG